MGETTYGRNDPRAKRLTSLGRIDPPLNQGRNDSGRNDPAKRLTGETTRIPLELVAVSGRNFNSSKLSCMISLPARMRMIDLKMKELHVECSQDFSHYKSMGIFPDAQGQLTPQSLVRSGRISNSPQMLWMSLLPASMKKI